MMKSIFSPPLTGRHVLAMLLAFFGVIFAVNGVFIYVAGKSFSGLETEHPFIKGLDYNRQLADARLQHERGWTVTIEQGDNSLTVVYHDRNGLALDDLAVSAFISRAATDRYDIRQEMNPMGEGRYSLTQKLPLKGQWLLRIEALQGNEKKYITEQTIFVK